MAYLKPQAPLMQGADYVYPITTADQVVLSDGSRFEKNGVATAQDSEKLGGKAPSEYLGANDTAVDSNKLSGKNASEYVLHSAALTLEEIKASTDLTGKIPDAAAVNTLNDNLCQGKFDSAYNLQQTGVTVPATWGAVVRISGQNWGPVFISDSYFLCITSGGEIYSGLQVNGATDITWVRQAKYT